MNNRVTLNLRSSTGVVTIDLVNPPDNLEELNLSTLKMTIFENFSRFFTRKHEKIIDKYYKVRYSIYESKR